MWPFRRKQTEDDTPVSKEAEKYYQAEKRERIGLAWILAVVTLAGTVIVVLGLFFGGRWVYHKVAHKNQPTTTQNPQTSSSNTESSGSGSSSGSASSSSNSTPPASSNNPPKPTTSSGTTPAPNNSATPNTGPGDTMAAFIIASALGFVVYELRLRGKLGRS